MIQATTDMLAKAECGHFYYKYFKCFFSFMSDSNVLIKLELKFKRLYCLSVWLLYYMTEKVLDSHLNYDSG
jgi:hypothetical protein